jgi:hypothetical protein
LFVFVPFAQPSPPSIRLWLALIVPTLLSAVAAGAVGDDAVV